MQVSQKMTSYTQPNVDQMSVMEKDTCISANLYQKRDSLQ